MVKIERFINRGTLYYFEVSKVLGNKFYEFYESIRKDSSKKERLVMDDPDLAFRIFNIFRDKEIGRLFIRLHSQSPQHHHTAYFVSVELYSHPIPRDSNPILDAVRKCKWVDPEWDPNKPHVCGNTVSIGNYRRENQFDNIVRAYEGG